MLTAKKLYKLAEDLDWKVDKDTDTRNITQVCFETYSDYGQDFIFYLDAGTSPGEEDPETLISNLRSYINGFDPVEEALKWTGPEGHGRSGAPEEFEDIVADMQQCLEMMNELLNSWLDGAKPTKTLPRHTPESLAEVCRGIMENKNSKNYGPFALDTEYADKFGEAWVDDPLYLTKVKNPTGTALLLSWQLNGDYTKAYVIPESEFTDYEHDGKYDRIVEILDLIFENL